MQEWEDRLARGLGNGTMEPFIPRAAAQTTVTVAQCGPPGTCFLPWAGREQAWKHLNSTALKQQCVTVDKAQGSRTPSKHELIITCGRR